MTIIFFFNDTATTEIYTLSLHDALPIYQQHATQQQRVEPDDRGRGGGDVRQPHRAGEPVQQRDAEQEERRRERSEQEVLDRKSTRLNSSHANISYAVFCLKKKYVDPETH